jgi:hypothetical protein
MRHKEPKQKTTNNSGAWNVESIELIQTKLKRLLILFLLFSPVLLSGQGLSVPVNVSVFNESTAVPFTKLFTMPVHPGLQIGSEYNYKVKEHSRVFQTANISYFFHDHLAQGVGINTELGYEYSLNSGLAFAGLIGVGYMHTFSTAEEFTFSNGEYVKKSDSGNSRFYPSISLDVGYYLNKSERNSPKLFLRYQSWLEYPYSPDFIPVMTHINFHLGVRFFINFKSR